jgi:hypothetical protein
LSQKNIPAGFNFLPSKLFAETAIPILIQMGKSISTIYPFAHTIYYGKKLKKEIPI